jgi:hypothetical protein
MNVLHAIPAGATELCKKASMNEIMLLTQLQQIVAESGNLDDAVCQTGPGIFLKNYRSKNNFWSVQQEKRSPSMLDREGIVRLKKQKDIAAGQ